jgi:DNA-binding NtrC family response regulator
MLVDDEQNVLNAIKRALMHSGDEAMKLYDVKIEDFSSPIKALQRAEDVSFDLVISDYRMPDMDGIAFLKSFKKRQPDAVRFVLSGYADLGGLVGAINDAQIYRFINKPWHDYELVSAVSQALSHRMVILENQRLADQMRMKNGTMSPQEYEMKRLEEESPGITKVKWGLDGSVILEEDDFGRG